MSDTPPGFFQTDAFGNILQAAGMSMLSSPGSAPLSGIGTYLPELQKQSALRQKEQEEKTKQNKTLGYLREKFPDIAAQVDAGLPVSDAFNFALKKETQARDDAQFSQTFGLQQDQYGLQRDKFDFEKQQDETKLNKTLEWAQGTGDPDVIGLVRAGDFNNAVSVYKEKRKPAGGATLPSGFMRDPNDASRLTPIPGGPGEQIPGELAARVGLADNFLKQAPALLEKVKAGDATGPFDRAVGGAFSGSGQAEVMRGLQSGTDALMRMLTGAGMTQSEADEYAGRYRPTFTDDANSAAQKVQQLQVELETIRDKVMRGRGGAAPAATQSSSPNYRSKYGLE